MSAPAKRSWNQPGKKAAGAAEAVASSASTAVASSSSTSAAASAAAAATTSAPSQPTGYMWAVRQIRTFEPRVFLHKHVFGIYWAFIAFGFAYSNYLQHERMKKLYPDYDVVARKSGQQYASMKEQELVDVQAFSAKAENMRSDLRLRM